MAEYAPKDHSATLDHVQHAQAAEAETSIQHKPPKVLNINQQVVFREHDNKKKNKNDFYRFLLQQNLQ